MPLSPAQQDEMRRRGAEMMRDAGVVLHEHEQRELELAGFGLDDFENQGLILHVYVNTDRYCGKELGLLPHQACPEHKHPPVPEENSPGKMETFRVRAGKVYLYLEGEGDRRSVSTSLPDDREEAYTVFHELVLGPGDQHTIEPDTLHWFKAGERGAVVTEFSSRSRDDLDIFTDPKVQRIES